MVSKVVSGFSIAIGAVGLLVLQTCSSGSGPRDQNWGSDVGRGHDAGTSPSIDAQDESQDESPGSDASTAMDATDDLSVADTTTDSDADGETMDGEAMTTQYTGGSQGGAGAAP